MAAATNTITKAEMTDAQVREVEFVEMFNESLKKLIEALGITRKIPKEAGTTLKTYEATGTLESGEVAEGEDIPLSKYKLVAKTYGELTLSKWRKSTTAEAIIGYGYEQAVTKTTDRMLKDAQSGIRKKFFDFLKETTDKTTATGTGLQAAVARTWAKLQTIFEDNSIDSVYFINPEDIADYLATAKITTQEAFGMKYIQDFLGMGTVILNSSVEVGKLYATAKDNLVLYYIPVNGADLGEAFEFTSDETGYIGIHEVANYNNLTAEDIVVSGIDLFAEVLKGCVITTIEAVVG
mgnify:CR=1 FL=1